MKGITKETRLESYVGRPVSRQREILNVLDAPMTAREIMKALHYSDMNAIRPRLSELLKEGKVIEIGKVYDPETDRNVTAFMRNEA